MKEEKSKKPLEKEPINWKEEVISWVKIIITAAILAFLLNTFIIANSRVPSGSMENTIMTGDRVIGFRLTYKFSEPERGDVAIFKWPDNEDILFVKRIIGLPGDTVNVVDGKVYINNSTTPLDEPYLKEPMIGTFGPYEVPDGYYFMMGDNRNFSEDSRKWDNTYVAKEKLIAKVYFRYFPSIGTID